MRIISGSGDARSATSIFGGTKNAQGHTIKGALAERMTVGKVLKSILFPSNGAYHKAKRRGERALAPA